MAYAKEIKQKAVYMRERGFSYKEITSKLGILKSTLSTWFSRTPHGNKWTREDQLEHLRVIRKLAKKAKAKRKEKEFQEIIQVSISEVDKYSLERRGVQMGIFSSLYWAEGTKHKKASAAIFTKLTPNFLWCM